MPNLPHTRGDEPISYRSVVNGETNLPHTRGDEPSTFHTPQKRIAICPTRVGMNRCAE